MKTKPFNELRNRMTSERRLKNEIRAQLALLHLTFVEQLKALDYTDEELEKDLSNFESAFSEWDTREDINDSSSTK